VSYKSLNQIAGGASSIALTPNSTTALTETLSISEAEQGCFMAAVVVGSLTLVGTVAVKLQHRPFSDAAWTDVKSTNVTASGTYTLINNTNNGTDGPIWPQARIVITSTNAGDAANITSVWAARRS
jgi:hypothetical protein